MMYFFPSSNNNQIKYILTIYTGHNIREHTVHLQVLVYRRRLTSQQLFAVSGQFCSKPSWSEQLEK